MNINLPEREKLNTQNLQRLFDNMSECYKLFWFQAIVEHVLNGKVLISYDSLLNTMIANAYGKIISKNVYAKTEEECEEKLAEMIKEMKAEIKREKEMLLMGM